MWTLWLLAAGLCLSTGSADNCVGRCGTHDLNSYTCQCNSECIAFGNCCEDYTDCDPLATCEGRNCIGHDSSLPCQCNTSCNNYNDCCPDYEAVCFESCAGRCGTSPDDNKSCQCNSVCSQYGDCCSDYEEQCSGSGTGSGTGSATSAPGSQQSVSNDELENASYQLWTLDVNSLPQGAVEYNVQGATTQSASNDVAPDPFFTYVDESYFQAETFQRLLALQDNYIRTQGYSEIVPQEELDEDSLFLDAVLNTAVGQYLYEFLNSKGYAGTSGIDGFKTILYDIWFGMYNRQATHDTSGFEHSFVGEIKGSGVSGFHSWVNFYYEELKGNFNYQGYLSQQEPRMVGMRHTWYGATKPINGFTIGTSPEIEFALYTLCHLTRPNSQCSINIGDDNGNRVSRTIQTYTWTKSYPPSGGSYIASAYFFT